MVLTSMEAETSPPSASSNGTKSGGKKAKKKNQQPRSPQKQSGSSQKKTKIKKKSNKQQKPQQQKKSGNQKGKDEKKGQTVPHEQQSQKKRKLTKKQQKKKRPSGSKGSTKNPFSPKSVEAIKQHSTMKHAHLEHLPIKEKLKIIVEGWFVCPGRKTNGPSRQVLKDQSCRTEISAAEYWRLECLGREFAWKTSGSKRHARKNLRLDRTYDTFALLPPLLWTHHARQRWKERGKGSIPRFVPGTYRTVVATVVPFTEGKRNYRRHAERHKQYLQSKQKCKDRQELAAERVRSTKAMQKRRSAIADTRRRQHRKSLAERKRRVAGGYVLNPAERNSHQRPRLRKELISILVRSRPKRNVPTFDMGANDTVHSRVSFSVPNSKRKPSDAMRRRIHELVASMTQPRWLLSKNADKLPDFKLLT